VHSRMETRSRDQLRRIQLHAAPGLRLLSNLRETHACELQSAPSDQWGNITVGTELARRKLGATVLGLVLPPAHEG